VAATVLTHPLDTWKTRVTFLPLVEQQLAYRDGLAGTVLSVPVIVDVL
jgi:hypothetical protein